MSIGKYKSKKCKKYLFIDDHAIEHQKVFKSISERSLVRMRKRHVSIMCHVGMTAWYYLSVDGERVTTLAPNVQLTRSPFIQWSEANPSIWTDVSMEPFLFPW